VKKTKFRFSTVSVTTGDSAELGPGHRCLLWSLHFHPELPREAGEEEMWGEGLWRARDHRGGPGTTLMGREAGPSCCPPSGRRERGLATEPGRTAWP
jgi:hypothetical protein